LPALLQSRLTSTLFPYTTLFRSQAHADQCEYVDRSYYTDGSVDFWTAPNGRKKGSFPADTRLQITHVYTDSQGAQWGVFLDQERDRKSTRLNSSHVSISYAVFCW